MPRVLARSLALRVGWSHGSEPDAGPARASGPPPFAGFACLPLTGPDNPSDFDALFAVAEGLDPGDPAEVLDNLREALQRERSEAEALPESLAAAHVWAREPRPGRRPAVRVSFVCVREGIAWAIQAPALPVYLFRDDVLRPLTPDLHLGRSLHPEAGELEPEIVSERLRDGDALLLCTESVHECLSGRQMREVLIHANSPETAARRLVAEARKEGAKHPAAAVLFSGVGPAVAHRLRSPALPPSGPPPTLARRRERVSVALVAGLAALAGTMLGLAAGVWIAFLRPNTVGDAAPQPISPQAAILPDSVPAATPLAEPMPATPPPPRPQPANAPTDAAANAPAVLPAGLAPAPNGPAAAAPPAPPPPPAPATPPAAQPAAQPAALTGEPPRHSIGPGLSPTLELRLRLDPQAGQVLVECSQGVIFGKGLPQGIPVGEALKIPLLALHRDRPLAGELRLVSGEQVAADLKGAAVEALLRGDPVALGPVPPGDYQLCWWNPQANAHSAPIAELRLAGL